jgi:hypothetical protein
MLWNCKNCSREDHPHPLRMGVNAATSRVNSEYLLHFENKERKGDVRVLGHGVHHLRFFDCSDTLEPNNGRVFA